MADMMIKDGAKFGEPGVPRTSQPVAAGPSPFPFKPGGDLNVYVPNVRENDDLGDSIQYLESSITKTAAFIRDKREQKAAGLAQAQFQAEFEKTGMDARLQSAQEAQAAAAQEMMANPQDPQAQMRWAQAAVQANQARIQHAQTGAKLLAKVAPGLAGNKYGVEWVGQTGKRFMDEGAMAAEEANTLYPQLLQGINRQMDQAKAQHEQALDQIVALHTKRTPDGQIQYSPNFQSAVQQYFESSYPAALAGRDPQERQIALQRVMQEAEGRAVLMGYTPTEAAARDWKKFQIQEGGKDRRSAAAAGRAGQPKPLTPDQANKEVALQMGWSYKEGTWLKEVEDAHGGAVLVPVSPEERAQGLQLRDRIRGGASPSISTPAGEQPTPRAATQMSPAEKAIRAREDARAQFENGEMSSEDYAQALRDVADYERQTGRSGEASTDTRRELEQLIAQREAAVARGKQALADARQLAGDSENTEAWKRAVQESKEAQKEERGLERRIKETERRLKSEEVISRKR